MHHAESHEQKSDSSLRRPGRKQIIYEGFRRNSVGWFLGALILFIITMPLVRHLPSGDVIESLFLTAVLLSAVMAVGGRRRTLVAATCLVTPAVAAKWVDHLRPELVPQPLIMITALAFIAFVIAHHLHFVLRAPRVNSEVLCAGIATYLMLAMFWAFAFLLASALNPASFLFSGNGPTNKAMDGFEAIYFSLGALSGVTFGDITPVTDAVRMLATLEAVVGTFYLAILIARLVSLYSTEADR